MFQGRSLPRPQNKPIIVKKPDESGGDANSSFSHFLTSSLRLNDRLKQMIMHGVLLPVIGDSKLEHIRVEEGMQKALLFLQCIAR